MFSTWWNAGIVRIGPRVRSRSLSEDGMVCNGRG